MKKYLILLAFISFNLSGQDYILYQLGGKILSFNGVAAVSPILPPDITYNFPANDSLLMDFSSYDYNTDTLAIGTSLYNSLAVLTNGTYKTDPDSGVYGDGLSRYMVIDTKENSAAQLGLEKDMNYRLEMDNYLTDLTTNDFFWAQYALGYWNIASTGQVEARLNTESGLVTRFSQVIYSAEDTWYDGIFFERNNETGDINANGTVTSNGTGGQWPESGVGYYMLDRISGGRGYNGWLRNFKMYNLGNVSTLAFNVRSDSSTIHVNPDPFLDDITVATPFDNVLEFTGGGTHGDYNRAYIDIDYHFTDDYKSISNSSVFADNKIEGDAYIRYALYVNDAMFAQSDTVRGQSTWDYHTTYRDNITISSRDKRHTDDLIYPIPEPNVKAKLRIWVFAKAGANVSLRNVGMRYKTDSEATSTLYDNGTPTVVDLGEPLATISFMGDPQPANNGEFQAYVKPVIDSAALSSDFIVTVGDNVEYDTLMFDSIANYMNVKFPNAVTTCNGNHDNYQNSDNGNYFKTAFKTFCDDMGVYRETEIYNGYEMIHTMAKVPNTDVYIIGYDDIDPTKLSTDITWAFEPDTTWILQKIRDTLAVNPDARFIINTHMPKASHESSSIGYGETIIPVQVFRAGLAEYPEVLGITTGHRHLYGQTTEENQLPCFVLSSMAKETGHPINLLYADVYEDRIRWYFHNFAGTPLSANQKDDENSIFDLGLYYNQFSIYDDWWYITK